MCWEQAVAFPARGRGNLSAVALAALHIRGAKLTAPPDTDCVGHHASLLMSPATLPALCALRWGPGCQLAEGPGEGGCPLPLPHCPGTRGDTRGSRGSCAGAVRGLLMGGTLV